MNDDRRSLTAPFAVLGALLAFGLITGGVLLGMKVRDFKRADRYVAVKGLVERTVKSDTATWPISFSEAADSLPVAFAASEKDKAAVIQLLTSQGFGPQNITVGSVSVTDKTTSQFGAQATPGPRFLVAQTITVQSGDVDRVAATNAKIDQLVSQGFVVQSAAVTYSFSGLNALKPDMITEATRNARASADRFAADSGSQVGAIRDANQGVFSISGADAGAGTDDAAAPDDGSIMKKVRVVSTIDYYLTN
jgi:hypothetical protein